MKTYEFRITKFSTVVDIMLINAESDRHELGVFNSLNLGELFEFVGEVGK